jgi:hypothetical protein
MNDGRGLVALSLLALLGVAAARSGSRAEAEGRWLPVFTLYGDFLDLEYGSPKWRTKISNAKAMRRGRKFDPAMDAEVLVTEADWHKLQAAHRLLPKLGERDRLVVELERTFPPEKLAKLKLDAADQRKLVAELEASLRAEIVQRPRGSRAEVRKGRTTAESPILVARRRAGGREGAALFLFGEEDGGPVALVSESISGPDTLPAALLAIPASALARSPDLENLPAYLRAALASSRIDKIVYGSDQVWHWIVVLPSGASLDLRVSAARAGVKEKLWAAMAALAKRLDVPLETAKGGRNKGSRAVVRQGRSSPEALWMTRLKAAREASKALPASEHDEEDEMLNHMIDGYVATALWSSIDDNEEHLDANYGPSDISDKAMAKMRTDCRDFLYLCEAMQITLSGCDESRVGHDFWLTRNHHGAGFWDGDYEEELGKQLTEIAHAFGEQDMYVGDDGQVYV